MKSNGGDKFGGRHSRLVAPPSIHEGAHHHVAIRNCHAATRRQGPWPPLLQETVDCHHGDAFHATKVDRFVNCESRGGGHTRETHCHLSSRRLSYYDPPHSHHLDSLGTRHSRGYIWDRIRSYRASFVWGISCISCQYMGRCLSKTDRRGEQEEEKTRKDYR